MDDQKLTMLPIKNRRESILSIKLIPTKHPKLNMQA